MRKLVAALAIAACLVMSVVGGLLPILQGWIFFVIALYLLATEFESGRRWVKAARRRWPSLDRWIVLAVLTLLVPFLHEALLLFALYLMATEFESGRTLVKGTRRRWPFLSRLI